MPISELRAALAAARAEMLVHTGESTREIVRQYQAVDGRLQAMLTDLREKIAAAQAAGEELGPSWLFQEARLESLERQLASELATFSRGAHLSVVNDQQWAVSAGAQQARNAGLAAEVTGTWAHLPAEAVGDLVGFTAKGSPLRSLFDQMGVEASRAFRDALIQGLALGRNPVAIAREARRATSVGLARALTISRTETLRALRESSRRSYEQNGVRGWLWVATLDSKTCAACFGSHGQRFPTGEPHQGHPNCRCTMAPDTPVTKQVVGDKGEARFAALPSASQRKILGPSRFKLYDAGHIKLEDTIALRRSRAWGTTRQVRSVRSLASLAETTVQ